MKFVTACLRKVLGTAKLCYDEMFTALAEVEVLLNNSLLTYVCAEETDCCLTPNRLLFCRTLELEPSSDQRNRKHSNLIRPKRSKFLSMLLDLNVEQSMLHHRESTTSPWTQAVRVD